MACAKNGDTVAVHYTGKLDDGTVFDSSVQKEPLSFTIGQGQLLALFEESVIGMEEGSSKTINIPAEQAYGNHDESKVFDVDRDRIPDDIELKVGGNLVMTGQDNQQFVLSIADVNDSTVTLDANHTLAGKDLTFDIELVTIQ